jgi:predicted HTH transcriptional regulator
MLKISQESEEDRGLAREHTKRMLQQERDHELNMLKIEQEKEFRRAQREIAGEDGDFSREESLKDSQTDAQEARIAMGLKREMSQDRLNVEREEREIAREDDLTRQQVAHEQAMEIMRLNQEMSPEQLMAMAAQKSPEAAKAMSDYFKSDSSKKECPKCGVFNSVSSKFCRKCAHRFTDV